jgi:hypothetical protein
MCSEVFLKVTELMPFWKKGKLHVAQAVKHVGIAASPITSIKTRSPLSALSSAPFNNFHMLLRTKRAFYLPFCPFSLHRCQYPHNKSDIPINGNAGVQFRPYRGYEDKPRRFVGLIGEISGVIIDLSAG